VLVIQWVRLQPIHTQPIIEARGNLPGKWAMIFSAYWFLVFFGVVLIIFYATPFPLIRSLVLAVASASFYWHFAGPAGVVPILILGAITYAVALSKKPLLLNLGMVSCVMALVFYKYTLFIVGNITKLIPLLGDVPVSSYAPTIAPLAISFFVFEFIHYLYDVKQGNQEIRNPLEFFHFSMFFPTLAAGPIKRFEQFIPALRCALQAGRVQSVELQFGLLRLASGFAKKLIADSLTVYIGSADAGFIEAPIETRWFILAAIAMRIYLDFSGYSDMAIGTARMMGIKVPENFNWPYLATNLTIFWRRWHISLSSWIRDYIYVPLGGNRVGPVQHALSLVLVFFLCGLWHGAAWNFVLWGLFHGAGLVVQSSLHTCYERVIPVYQRLTVQQDSLFAKSMDALLTPVGWILNKLLAVVGWVLNERVAPTVQTLTVHQKVLITRTRDAMLTLGAWTLTTFFVWTGWLLFFYPPARAYKMFLSLFKF